MDCDLSLSSGIMGYIEGRTIAEGLPWRRMFRIEYWQVE
jgi:hypothetical protein